MSPPAPARSSVAGARRQNSSTTPARRQPRSPPRLPATARAPRQKATAPAARPAAASTADSASPAYAHKASPAIAQSPASRSSSTDPSPRGRVFPPPSRSQSPGSAAASAADEFAGQKTARTSPAAAAPAASHRVRRPAQRANSGRALRLQGASATSPGYRLLARWRHHNFSAVNRNRFSITATASALSSTMQNLLGHKTRQGKIIEELRDPI